MLKSKKIWPANLTPRHVCLTANLQFTLHHAKINLQFLGESVYSDVINCLNKHIANRTMNNFWKCPPTHFHWQVLGQPVIWFSATSQRCRHSKTLSPGRYYIQYKLAMLRFEPSSHSWNAKVETTRISSHFVANIPTFIYLRDNDRKIWRTEAEAYIIGCMIEMIKMELWFCFIFMKT